MKITTPRLISALPALVLACGVWCAVPATAQDGADLPERRWQTVRRSELVAGAGASPWQNATDTAVDYTLTPDPQDANADLLIVRPLAAAVGATGRGNAAVGFGPEAATVFRIDRATGAVTRVDGAASAALKAVSTGVAAPAAESASDTNTEAEGEGGDVGRAAPEPRRVSVPLGALGTGLDGLGDAEVETTSTPVTVNGQTVAHLQQYRAAPLSFTTPEGDTVLLRAGGYTALDPSGAVVLASGQNAAGQVVTAAGDLLPYATRQSSRAGAADGGADPLIPAARAALNALLPAAAPLTSPDYSVPRAGGADVNAAATPPAWAGAVTTVAAGLDALATAAGGAFGEAPDPFAAARAASGFAAAATGDRVNALAVNGAAGDKGSDNPTAAYRGLAQRTGGGAGTGLLADNPGGTVRPAGGDGAASPAAAALAAALPSGPDASTSAASAQNPLAPAPAENPLAPSGSPAGPGSNRATAGATPPAPGAAGLAALDAPRAPRDGASGPDAVRSALGGGAGFGGSVATALGGGAVYGINPATGAAGALPSLATQVVVNDAGQQRSDVANLAFGGGALAPFVPSVGSSTGGFVDISIPGGAPFNFYVYDSGSAEDNDRVDLAFRDARPGTQGDDNVLLLFLADPSSGVRRAGSTGNPDPSNVFSASVIPGPAELSLQALTSDGGPTTGTIVVTSTVNSGPTSQVFNLDHTVNETGVIRVTVDP